MLGRARVALAGQAAQARRWAAGDAIAGAHAATQALARAARVAEVTAEDRAGRRPLGVTNRLHNMLSVFIRPSDVV